MNIYENITNAILQQLEKGTAPWRADWNRDLSLPRNSKGDPYSGINVPILWTATMAKGYSNPSWMTYKQAQTLGGQVKKGEKASNVVYWSTFQKEKENGETDSIPFMKSYAVFNVEQIEHLPESFYESPKGAYKNLDDKIAHVDGFVTGTKANIGHGGGRCFYAPASDSIKMPNFGDFKNAQAYYAALLHELTHWTGHESRLARKFGHGNAEYAREELVAELGAAFLCARLEIENAPNESHASYLGEWLKILKTDSRAIFQAASLAQKASDYLYGLQNA